MILVLYFNNELKARRNTIYEHLYSFRKNLIEEDILYYNAAIGIPSYLRLLPLEAVIIHYTFLSTRWGGKFYRKWSKIISNLARLKGIKIAIPQDEYCGSEELCEFFNKYKVDIAYTCFKDGDIENAYRSSIGMVKKFVHVFPGYIDSSAIQKIEKFFRTHDRREIDVGYRARKLPYWLGRHGQLKFELSERFRNALSDRQEINFNISTSYKDVFVGDDWYKFLCNCRCVLGCEGGASLLDEKDGSIRKTVEQYVSQYPNATFEETEKACFPEKDYNIRLFSLSPRHFECAITKTCQVMLEGEYEGIFKPGVHYIEIKNDYSNIDGVIAQIKDKAHCQRIAENAYRDIVQSRRYTYGEFNRQVLHDIRSLKNNQQEALRASPKRPTVKAIQLYLKIRDNIDSLLSPLYFTVLVLRFYRKEIVAALNRRLFSRDKE